MLDREKVIKGLEICKERNYCCPECPYYDRDAVMGCHSNELMADALALLEEQEEPVDIEMEGGGSTWSHVCGECHGAVDNNDRFCRHCGRPFKQKKSGCNGCTYKGGEDCPLNYMTDGNFFCPNGKLE